MKGLPMFCPQCKAEYRQGFTTCSDCQIALVESLPQESLEYAQYAALLRTYNAGDVDLIKSMLDAESIAYYFKGENFNLVYPLVDPAVLMVRVDHLQDAKNVLRDLDIAYLGVSAEQEDSDVEEDD